MGFCDTLSQFGFIDYIWNINSSIMKISTKNITEIKNRLRYLQDYYRIDESEYEIKVGDEDIFICYPEDEYIEAYPVSDFLKYTEDIKSLKKVNDSTVKTQKIRQTIIDVDEYEFQHYGISDFKIETEKFIVSFVSQPIYIGLIASRDSMYNEDFGIYACSSYIAIEIAYKNDITMSTAEEDNVIVSFLFQLSSKFNTPIKIGRFLNWPDYDISEGEEKANITIDSLLNYSEAMGIYIQALSIKNEEIRYLYFYKIIEYFAPLVAKKKSYELLNQKLDSLSIKHRDHKYLESIFSLTRQYDVSIKDKELAYTVLNECIDIIELYEYLPDAISKKLSKTVQFKETEYESLSTEKIDAVKKTISQILYATRNDIVHAKSNYNRTGNECLADDMEQLNFFMSKLCYCLIAWNSRQSDDYRV